TFRLKAGLRTDFPRSLHVALRRPETMRINHEETKRTKKRPEKTFVLFVSSWLILLGDRNERPIELAFASSVGNRDMRSLCLPSRQAKMENGQAIKGPVKRSKSRKTGAS